MPPTPTSPPRILVAYASRHAATEEIAAAIAAELGAAGCNADLVPAATVGRVDGFAAAVVGSAVYLGKWDESAVGLLRRERAGLAAIPTWIFSSGPVGEGVATARPERLPQPDDVADLAREIGARAMTFGGRVDPDDDAFAMQIMATAGLAGDWRDFRRIRAWGRGIAADVLGRAAAARETMPGDAAV